MKKEEYEEAVEELKKLHNERGRYRRRFDKSDKSFEKILKIITL